ncbi:hypothetical protein O3M35_004823 [Rhynocoris fuscipes]
MRSMVTQTDNISGKTSLKPRPWRFHAITKENWNGDVEVIDLVHDTPNKFKNQYRPPQHVKSPHRIRKKAFTTKQRNDLNNSNTGGIKVLAENRENTNHNLKSSKSWPSTVVDLTMAYNFNSSKNNPKDISKMGNSQRLSPENTILEKDEYFKLLNSFINKEAMPSRVPAPKTPTINIDLTNDSGDELPSASAETTVNRRDRRHSKLLEDANRSNISLDNSMFQPRNVTVRRKVRPSSSTWIDTTRNRTLSHIISLVDDEDEDMSLMKTPPVPRINSLEDKIKAQSLVSEEQWTCDLIRKYNEKKTEMEEMTRMLAVELKIASEKQSSTFNDITLKKLTRHLEITESFLEDDLEEPALPELTPEMEEIIKKACIKHPADEVLIEKYNYKIRRCDIHTLTGLNWLNDEIINFYTTLIMERSKTNTNLPKVYSFSTFFYLRLVNSGYQGVKRWTKKVDIFEHDLIIIPVHLQMHWCLAAIDRVNKTINYYDSMGTNNDPCLKNLEEYLISEYKDKKGKILSMDGWTKNNLKDIPRQNNGSDCGVFSCTFAEFLSRRAKFTFQQKDMPYLRLKMIYEIVTGKLIT